MLGSPGDVGAEAEVLTATEPEVAIGLARDVELEGSIEDGIVAIGGRVEQDEMSPA